MPRAQAIYRFPLVVKKDVQFRLLSIDSVKFGDGFEVVVNAKVKNYPVIIKINKKYIGLALFPVQLKKTFSKFQ